jgi:hypothetical protein
MFRSRQEQFPTALWHPNGAVDSGLIISGTYLSQKAGASVSDNGRPLRSWQQIAEEASREKDPKKFQQLANELELAFDERDRKLQPPAVPTDNVT